MSTCLLSSDCLYDVKEPLWVLLSFEPDWFRGMIEKGKFWDVLPDGVASDVFVFGNKTINHRSHLGNLWYLEILLKVT